MDRSAVLTLIAQTYEKDPIGQMIPAESRKDVFCGVSSVSASEWMEAGKIGLNPEYRFTVFFDDYSGERIVEYEGNRLSVYRTYRKNDTVELYTERKAGSEN